MDNMPTTCVAPSGPPTEPSGRHLTATFFLSLWDFLLSSTALREGAKLFLVGSILELARRVIGLAWRSFVEFFFITAEFEDRDETFTWMMFWLSRHPRWNKLRSIRVTTFRYGQSGVSNLVPGEEEERKAGTSRRLAYVPSHNKALNMWHRWTWMSVTVSQTPGDMWNRRGDERLKITLFTRNISKLDDLLREAKKSYKKHSEGRINIYVSDANNEWTLAGSRPRRPLSSVILEKHVKEHLLADANDFMASEKWYAERGIPWRRGYLLHGSPGSGKTSLIHSLAGELQLDIYLIALSKKSLDDSTLNELISKIPPRSLAIMEDIDAAFYRGVTRENESLGVPLMPGQPPGDSGGMTGHMSASAVTLSGLLGAIDGVAAQEGRLLFATTNKYSALDPALIRPGRLDVHIRFDNAGKRQAAELFRCFFPPMSDEDEDIGDGKTVDGERCSDEPASPVAARLLPTSFLTSSSSSMEVPYGKRAVAAMNTIDPDIPYLHLTRTEVRDLSLEFAKRIPEGEFSMAALQGLLMQYKTRPYRVINEVEAWVAEERRKRAEREGRMLPFQSDKEKDREPIVSDEQKGMPISEEVVVGDASDIDGMILSPQVCAWWPLGTL